MNNQTLKTQKSANFVLRYVFRHVRRSVLKSVLAVAVAALMVAAITQFAQMRITYAQMRVNTVIKPKFIDSCPLYELPVMEMKGYAADIYYEETLQADVHVGYEYFEKRVAITNDIGRYTGEEYEITYAPGYDESCLTKFGDIVIVGKDLIEQYGLQLGDTILISPQDKMRDQMIIFKSQFMKDFPDEFATDENVRKAYGEMLDIMIDEFSSTVTIAGMVSTVSGSFDDSLFTPGMMDPLELLETGVLLDLAEFRLADNELVSEMREYGKDIAEGKSGSFIMDTAKLDSVISTAALLDSLYPVAIAAALIIGGFLCALVIVQTSKDAAIMRIQGTTKTKTRVILVIEQIMLSVAGLIIGAGAMAVIKGAQFTDVAAQTGMFAGMYLIVIIAASVVSAVLATRKNVLELLQTKE